MVTINQIQRGFTKFVDNDVAVAYSGLEKAVILGGSTLLAANLPNIVTTYASDPMISAMGVYQAATGAFDIDALYNAFVPNMGAEKIPVTLPKIGKMDLGTIKIGKDEIDTIVKYIKES